MIIGIDIGYSHVKGAVNSHVFSFPSVVGSPETAAFSLSADSRIALDTNHGLVQVGQAVLDQSRFVSRPEDRGWITSDEYKWLYLAALSESTTTFYSGNVTVITGLPIAYYRDDAETLRKVILGSHPVQREGRRAQTFVVADCRVVPQPFGTLASVAFGPNGESVDADMLKRPVGIVDIGGHTTNLLSMRKAQSIDRETGSVDMGAWDIVRAVKEYLATRTPGLSPEDYEIVEAIKARSISYFGRDIDLSGAIEEALGHFRRQVLAEATHLWNHGADLYAILVTGGGAHLIGDDLLTHFSEHERVRIVDRPVFANAVGYVRFGRYLEER